MKNFFLKFDNEHNTYLIKYKADFSDIFFQTIQEYFIQE